MSIFLVTLFIFFLSVLTASIGAVCLYFFLDYAWFFGFLVVLVLRKGTYGGAVGLIDDDNEAVLEDVVGMLDLFFAG